MSLSDENFDKLTKEIEAEFRYEVELYAAKAKNELGERFIEINGDAKVAIMLEAVPFFAVCAASREIRIQAQVNFLRAMRGIRP